MERLLKAVELHGISDSTGEKITTQNHYREQRLVVGMAIGIGVGSSLDNKAKLSRPQLDFEEKHSVSTIVLSQNRKFCHKSGKNA